MRDERLHRTFDLMFYASILLLMFDRLYTPTGGVTGQYNPIVTTVLTGLMLIRFGLSGIKPERKYVLFLYVCVMALLLSLLALGGQPKETARYVSILTIVCLAAQLRWVKLHTLMRLLMLCSIGYTLFDMHNQVARVSGFLTSSPTLFSLSVLIALTYLVFRPGNKLDIALAFTGGWVIFMTGSRSTLALSLLFLAIGTMQQLFKGKNKAIVRKMLIGFIFIGAYFLAVSIMNQSIVIREDEDYSTQTRENFLYSLQDYMKEHPAAWLTGSGAGASYSLVSDMTGRSTPSHFDPATILVDYGIPGIAVMLLFPLLIRRFAWQGWALLIVGSIHNIIYFPAAVLLIMAVGRTLAVQPQELNQEAEEHSLTEGRKEHEGVFGRLERRAPVSSLSIEGMVEQA